ncbi:MAG: hypothetical protein RLZZ171_1203 [Cyanobacteriota bacterium]|jgi:ABC-type siderophore export system fused ATPase/permease subunit
MIDNILVDDVFLCAVNERLIHDKSLDIYRKFTSGYYTDLWLQDSFKRLAKIYSRKYSKQWQLSINSDETLKIASLLQDYYHPDNYGQ